MRRTILALAITSLCLPACSEEPVGEGDTAHDSGMGGGHSGGDADDTDGYDDSDTDGDDDGETDGESGGSTGGDTDGEGDQDTMGVTDFLCGNGEVENGEECDLGNDNDDQGACTHVCRIATCGDGLLYVDSEECDDGEMNGEPGHCSLSCTHDDS